MTPGSIARQKMHFNFQPGGPAPKGAPRLSESRAIVAAEANSGKPSRGYEAMARRRFQSPQPFKEGQFWWLRVWDTNQAGNRKRQRIKLAPAPMPVREVAKDRRRKAPARQPRLGSDRLGDELP